MEGDGTESEASGSSAVKRGRREAMPTPEPARSAELPTLAAASTRATGRKRKSPEPKAGSKVKAAAEPPGAAKKRPRAAAAAAGDSTGVGTRRRK
jgi:hypothetical protein